MAYNSRYDDPDFINAFLADMRVNDTKLTQDADAPNDEPDTKPASEAADRSTYSARSRSQSETTAPVITSAASSPPTGIRAPPPTPESKAASAPNVKHLPPIDEGSDAGNDESRSLESSRRSTTPQKFSPMARPFRPQIKETISPLSVIGTSSTFPENSFTYEVLSDEKVKNYRQNAFEKFREEALARIALRDSTNQPRRREVLQSVSNEDHPASTDANEYRATVDSDLSKSTDNDVVQKFTSTDTENFHDAQDESTAVSSRSDDSSVNIIVDAPDSPGSIKSKKHVVIISSPAESATVEYSPGKKEDNHDAVNIKIEPNAHAQEESREDAVYFSSWGQPSARATGPARVRKIILSRLPATTDFTLVQSLIHGGAIETMTMFLSPESALTAYVTFTDADACDAYYNKYPNGLDFKYKGKKHTAFVEKGKEVDVVSGVTRTQLDCGASRVIKAAGADDDWSMRALHRIAGGKDGRRKVETISDNYRNESRDIVFRFTKISDAVAFRGQLLRDPDWEGTDIQFMADPCEKATGAHFE